MEHAGGTHLAHMVLTLPEEDLSDGEGGRPLVSEGMRMD